MTLKKHAALLLIAVLAAAVLAGCSRIVGSAPASDGPSPGASGASAAPGPAGSALNAAGAYKSHDPKTVMLKVDGKDITWETLFFYIYNAIEELRSNGVQITGWSSVYQEEDGTTFKDYVLSSAVNSILQDAAIKYGAEHETHVTLTPEDTAAIQSDWDEKVKSAGGEAAFTAQLQSRFETKDIYLQQKQVDALYKDCFDAMYGDKGSKLPDKDVAGYAADEGYIMAKRILFLTTKTDKSGTDTPMNTAEKAQVKTKAEGALGRLEAYNGTDFGSFFDQLMKTDGQDPVMASDPKGYLFQSGDSLDGRFVEAVMALQVGQFARELLETDYGYQIIYRVPVDYDATPMKYAGFGDYPLRLVAAREKFKADMDVWLNSIDITYTDKYKKLDFDRMFAAG